ncbi:hypothetical protein JTE90_026074 [Oedothorax gibbosus]|uniref:Integrase p58-like C-terminal domain-containing protein n=1 Tax=Oedothorax gibbosus TaxID=931172 RepID=A0AAV6TYA7_9ARAC|nr:hypothetical protein JTE90_026074 [Oedothorax gibbosus]
MQHVYRNIYQNLENAAAKQSRLRDNVAKSKSFELGQKVYLYTPATNQSTGRAFSKKFSGPFRVIQKHSDLNYTIQDNDKPFSKSVKVHVDRLFDYTERRSDLQLSSQVSTENSNTLTSTQIADNGPNYSNQFSWYDDPELAVHTPSLPQNREIRSQDTAVNNREPSPDNTPLGPTNKPLDKNETNITTQTKQIGTRTEQPQTIPKQVTHSYNLRSRPAQVANTNSSLSNRVLGWALNSGDENSTNILDKMSNALANHLSLDLERDQINNILIRPQETKIFYNSFLEDIHF